MKLLLLAAFGSTLLALMDVQQLCFGMYRADLNLALWAEYAKQHTVLFHIRYGCLVCGICCIRTRTYMTNGPRLKGPRWHAQTRHDPFAKTCGMQLARPRCISQTSRLDSCSCARLIPRRLKFTLWLPHLSSLNRDTTYYLECPCVTLFNEG